MYPRPIMDDSTMSSPYYTSGEAGSPPTQAQEQAVSPSQEDDFSPASNPAEQKNLKDRNTHPCPYEGCGRLLVGTFTLAQHVREKHTRTREFRCQDPSCGKGFNRAWGCNRHMAVAHGIKAGPGRGRGRRTKNKTKQTRNATDKNDSNSSGNEIEDSETGEERPLATSNGAYCSVQCYLCQAGFNNRGDVLEHYHIQHAVPQSVYCSCRNCTEDMRGQGIEGMQAQQQLKANGMVTIVQQEAPSMIDPSLEMADFTLYGGQQNTTGHGAVSMDGQLAGQYGSQMPTNYNTNGSAFGSSFQNHVADNSLEPTILAGSFDAFGSLNYHNYAGPSGLSFNDMNAQDAFGGGEINEDMNDIFMSGMAKEQGGMNSGLYSISSAADGDGEIV
ncbi:Transcription factor IIIA [Elasticomyces elasticus]|nr:Transcription factor IIIA [Elasticomyces elasticus]